ncbi:hypothetical protein THRCLA_23474 [Thraustotheca clavata]|uniref:Oxidoreductase-like domain-containing protein n=1 Tax=Thraustotheca clavata TaxID=74557 RepID=A0A1V9Y452_9STRA|nr:hypothetical protein THRCLA_23474 [Thraustotheca clavata]
MLGRVGIHGRGWFSTQVRTPKLRDLVVLAPGIAERNGLKAGDVAKVILHDIKDVATPYRLQIPNTLERPWFAAEDIVLADPNASQPAPEPPGDHECCGSSCPNCVWISHWAECQEWEAEQQKAAS